MGLFSNLFKQKETLSCRIVNGEIDRNFYYFPDTYTQDTSKSVINQEKRYDLKRFSRHEFDTIQKVIKTVDKKYPKNLRAIGLANEANAIVYKARYVLFDIIIVQYENSSTAIDRLAVALAYESKGAFFRKEAISYFESSIQDVDNSILSLFISYEPYSLYNKFSVLYEKEHDYEKAISYMKKAKASKGANKEYCKEKIEKLEKKLESPPRTRKSKKPDYYNDFEQDVRKAAIAFITNDFTGIELNVKPNHPI